MTAGWRRPAVLIFAPAGSFPHRSSVPGEAVSGTVTVVAAEPRGQ